MAKTMIAPIVAVVALLVKTFFGIEIEEDLQNQIIETIGMVVLAVVAVHGVVKNHKKE